MSRLFVFRVMEAFEPEMCEVLAGVGSLRCRIFPVHCMSLSDAQPHHFSFNYNASSANAGENYCMMHSDDTAVCVTSAEHIKCAVNDDFYRAVFDVA